MIRFGFAVQNPFKYKEWRDVYQGSWSITKNKTLEIQVSRYAYNLLEFELDTRWSGNDHAGPKLEIGLFGFEFSVGIVDNRHWDYENNCWEKHED